MMAGLSGSATADIALLTRVAGRDAGALGELYDRHNRLLFSLILRVLRDRGESEDVLQEVFVRVWDRADSYSPALGTPLAWLVRIARNRAIDRLRSRQVRANIAESYEIRRWRPTPRRPATPNSWLAPPSIAAPSSPRSISCQPSNGPSSTPPISRASRSRNWPSASTCRLAL